MEEQDADAYPKIISMKSGTGCHQKETSTSAQSRQGGACRWAAAPACQVDANAEDAAGRREAIGAEGEDGGADVAAQAHEVHVGVAELLQLPQEFHVTCSRTMMMMATCMWYPGTNISWNSSRLTG